MDHLDPYRVPQQLRDNEPGIKSETSGVMWHVAPESKIQLINCELSAKFPLGNLSLSDIRAIDAYIFWSVLFLALLYARLHFSFKRTCFRHFHYVFLYLDILQLDDLQIRI